ncbi:hypothetical protein NRB_07680 [Novosphingobium sp. 11B]
MLELGVLTNGGCPAASSPDALRIVFVKALNDSPSSSIIETGETGFNDTVRSSLPARDHVGRGARHVDYAIDTA